MVSVLCQGDPLPGSKEQSAGSDRNRKGIAEHAAFHVRRHIVWSFDGMHERLILGYLSVESRLEVGSNIRIGIFSDRQAADVC